MNKNITLNKNQLISLIYHNFFDFPLTTEELTKWTQGNQYNLLKKPKVYFKHGYYFLTGLKSPSSKRLKREKLYKNKLKIAQKATKHLSLLPTIKMIAVTGSLAMKNPKKNSDIDLMLITQKNLLWSTRLLSTIFLKLFGFSLRKAGDKNEKDKLCLNIWLDESDLLIQRQNIYTAHEIAQIIPLLNKTNTYEKFVLKNNWLLNYWPNSLKLKSHNIPNVKQKSFFLFSLLESLFRWLQLAHMKPKITNEFIIKTQVFFHPLDRGKLVEKYLKQKGVYLN